MHQQQGAEPARAGWDQLAAGAPEGLALVNSAGQFVLINEAGARMCGCPAGDLTGTPAPFGPDGDSADMPPGPFDDGPAELVTAWSPEPGIRRELAYRARRLPGDPALTAIAFRDVTGERQRQRRVAAIARTSANLASHGSLTAILDALAAEVVRADALAGVQIVVQDGTGGRLRIMGSAGFRRWPDFFDRLMECQRGGAALCMLDSFRSGEPVVVANRWTVIRDDPVWQPLHDYLSEVDWDSFASLPLVTRGRAVGVLNVFFAPGQAAGRRTMEFLAAMAEQAVIAVDYATLMQQAREGARREERQRLARDLHDSIVQQVFSISMQAKSLEMLARRAEAVPAAAAVRTAAEVSALSLTALADLRAMLRELRPSLPAAPGDDLAQAIRALAESTSNRCGLRFDLVAGQGVERVTGELAEDVYWSVAEAIHNVVRHAEAGSVRIRLSVRDDRLTATVTDDGVGMSALTEPSAGEATAGYGLTSMRERAQRWGGNVRVTPGRSAGTVVRLTVPLAASGVM